MSAQKKPVARARKPARPALPVVSVARFEEAAKLIEQLVAEKQDVFLDAAQRFRERHREATSRALNAMEAAQVAAGLMRSDVEAAVLVQRSDLRAYDEPSANEIFVAAGMATAPAFLDACGRLVALIEMPDITFEEACETGTLEDAIDEVRESWRKVPMQEARERAAAALEHFAKAGGASSVGEALRLLMRIVMQAHQQTVMAMTPSASSSLIGSPPSMDGPGETSSTASPTGTP
jgi:hypothetical protein